MLLFGYGFGLNVSNVQESNVEKRKPAQIITEIRSLLNQNIIRHQNKNYGRTLAPVDEACLEL